MGHVDHAGAGYRLANRSTTPAARQSDSEGQTGNTNQPLPPSLRFSDDESARRAAKNLCVISYSALTPSLTGKRPTNTIRHPDAGTVPRGRIENLLTICYH